METIKRLFKKMTAKAVKFEKGKSPYTNIDADDGISHALARRYGVGL